MKPRDRAWMRDEVILALDLYLREQRNPSMDACAEVSLILRAIPIEMAKAIRANVDSLSPAEAEVEDEEVVEAPEGAILTRVHRKRERSAKLRMAKTKAVKESTGRLACEACDLDFGERYGDWGKGFIECHHVVPVSSLRPGQKTSIDDLVLLCSNCHRMLHVRRPWLTLDELIDIQAGD